MTASIFNTENEKLLLGAIMRGGADVLSKILKHCQVSDFYEERHRITIGTCLDLAKQGIPINELEVKKALEAKGQLDKVGFLYLVQLADGIPLALDHVFYAKQVARLAADRRVLANAAALQDANGNFEEICQELTKSLIRRQQNGGDHSFKQISEGRFQLEIPEAGAVFEADRLRREHHELTGELSIRINLPGARTYDGNLSIADFNFSSARARKERAGLLADRSGSREIDFVGHLEEFCQRILSAERAGQPAVDLRTIERPGPDDTVYAAGFALPRRLPTIIFGDGGACKSYLALFLLGSLIKQGMRVGYFDWELAGEDHRDRLERIYGPSMPEVFYRRCERSLVYEADSLARIVRDNRLDYAIYDSVVFAVDGPPESAEIAGRYFRAVRQIGIGSLHVAHVTKSEGGDQKPFGSVFWHNGARSTYYIQLADSSPDGKTLSLGIFNRKANLSGLRQPFGFQVNFGENRTTFIKSDPADVPDLAEKMTIRQRMIGLLKSGPKTFGELAEEMGANPDSVRKTGVRNKSVFRISDNGKVSLLQRDTESGHFVRRTLYERVSGGCEA